MTYQVLLVSPIRHAIRKLSPLHETAAREYVVENLVVVVGQPGPEKHELYYAGYEGLLHGPLLLCLLYHGVWTGKHHVCWNVLGIDLVQLPQEGAVEELFSKVEDKDHADVAY